MTISREGEARCIETGLQDGTTPNQEDGEENLLLWCLPRLLLPSSLPSSRRLFPWPAIRFLMIILIMLRVNSHYNEMQRYFTSHPPHLVHCGDHFCPGHCQCHAHHRALSMLKVVQLVRKWPNGQEWPKVAEMNSTRFYSLFPQNIHLNISEVSS